MTTIQIRRDTEYNWTIVNPILLDGEQGYETDTNKMKIGNGTDDWNTLDYFVEPPTPYDPNLEINNQTGTTYTLALTDSNKYIRMDNASANTVIVPLNSSVAFAIGTQIYITQVGAGQTTISSSATINTAQTLLLGKQFSSVVLIKVQTDVWDLAGDLELV